MKALPRASSLVPIGRGTSKSQAASNFLPFLVVLLTGAIFVTDTVTNLEIAVAVFYVVVVLLAVTFASQRGVILISVTCMALTIVSFFLTLHGDIRSGVTNTFISLVAIGITTYLAVRIQAAQQATEEARMQLAHLSRVSTLGELATSIAHEVNQPLGAIAANGNALLHWLSADSPNLDEVVRAVGFMIEDANRASEVIARLRNLARRAPPERLLVDVNSVVETIAALMQHEVRRNRIALRLELDDSLSLIRGDQIQLQQVVLNLLLNAIDAITAVEGTTREIGIQTKSDSDKTVRITISDSGTGIEPDRLERVFEAFYTTKPDGMGVGLAISRSIIESHGGRIFAAAGAPLGTVFHILLPAIRDTRQ